MIELIIWVLVGLVIGFVLASSFWLSVVVSMFNEGKIMLKDKNGIWKAKKGV